MEVKQTNQPVDKCGGKKKKKCSKAKTANEYESMLIDFIKEEFNGVV